MPAFHQVTNFSFLEKIGISELGITKLKQKNISLSIGYFDLRFVNADGDELITIKLSKSTNDLAKKQVPANVLTQILAQIENTIHKIYTGEIKAPNLDGISIPPSSQISFVAQSQAAEQKIADASEIIEGFGESKLVKLRDATTLYQPVRGTDAHSTYYVIGIADKVKIALKATTGHNYSIRVEGSDIPTSAIEAMASMGIEAKGDYLSGHFHNPDHVPVQRSVGAILASMGLDFNTPLPNMAKVLTLCGVS